MAGVLITIEIGSESDEVPVDGSNEFQWNGSVNGNVPVTVRASFSDVSTYGDTFSDNDVGCDDITGPPQGEP
jgi:hypothetical protein